MDSTVLKALVDHLPYFVFWKDRQSVYLGCNEATARVSGLASSKEIIGKTDYDLAWTKEEADWYRRCDRLVMDSDQPELNIRETQRNAAGEKTVILTSKLPLHDESGTVIGILGFFTNITETIERKEQLDLQESILNKIANGVLVAAPDGTIRWANPAISSITGYTIDELIGANVNIFKSGKQDEQFYHKLWSKITKGMVWHDEIINKKKDGSLYTEEMTITPLRGDNGEIDNLIAVKMDISEKKELENMLTQSYRLESIGRLAAGIAHEINTPTQYVGDNTAFLQSSFENLSEILEKYQDIVDAIKSSNEKTVLDDKLKKLNQAQEELDLEYLLDEIPRAFEQTKDGINRIVTIVRSMKEFSHPGSESPEPIDILRSIQSTLSVAQNEWKYDASVEVEINDDIELKTVPCFAGEFNQVILNIVVNAAHAIKEKRKSTNDNDKGLIRITGRQNQGFAEIQISDTGSGIPADKISKIFDPFFTTKKVGEGTGQGLHIAYSSIVTKHKGTLKCESEEGIGTIFTIKLPLKNVSPGSLGTSKDIL